MFVLIANDPRDYAWGSTSAIADLLGRRASGGPEAELWLGAHPANPSRIVRPADAEGAETLADFIAADPQLALGDAGARGLPYLLKVLAAAAPLSLQAHPSIPQAEAGFARENAAGVALDAPDRNYKDRGHKPELIVAVSERFSALSGFRTAQSRARVIDELESAATADEAAAIGRLATHVEAGLEHAVGWLLEAGDDVASVVDAVVAIAARARADDDAADDDAADDDAAEAFATVRLLAEHYAGDPGIVISLLLNTLQLARGEALYLPAGNIHAYLDGLGIELMAASDNVLRGGLTPKHVDVPELLTVLRFDEVPPPRLPALPVGEGVTVYRPGIPDFELVHFGTADDEERHWPLAGPAIALCTAGRFELLGDTDAIVLERGDSCFVTPDEVELTVRGDGELFLATPGAASEAGEVAA